MKVAAGSKLKLAASVKSSDYTNREGVVIHIDDAGQIHGTWGGCAIIPKVDIYQILKA